MILYPVGWICLSHWLQVSKNCVSVYTLGPGQVCQPMRWHHAGPMLAFSHSPAWFIHTWFSHKVWGISSQSSPASSRYRKRWLV